MIMLTTTNMTKKIMLEIPTKYHVASDITSKTKFMQISNTQCNFEKHWNLAVWKTYHFCESLGDWVYFWIISFDWRKLFFLQKKRMSSIILQKLRKITIAQYFFCFSLLVNLILILQISYQFLFPNQSRFISTHYSRFIYSTLQSQQKTNIINWQSTIQVKTNQNKKRFLCSFVFISFFFYIRIQLTMNLQTLLILKREWLI